MRPLLRFLPLLLGLAVVGAVRGATSSSTIVLRDGWVRLLPANLPAAGYVTIENRGADPVELTGVAVDGFAEAQLHESYATPGGGAGMREVKTLTIPAHGTVRLAPGGYHLMLMQPRRALKPGESVEAEFTFGAAGTARASLVLRPANYEPSAATTPKSE